jgi:hypothetical protein
MTETPDELDDPGRDAEAEAAWEAELQRRAEEIRNGTAKGRPAKEAIAELREKYSRNS